MSLKVHWSDRLEALSDRLFRDWEETPPRDPFSRVCIVVGDMATRSWLQGRFLFGRARGGRRILANIDFKPLPEFVNDWLAAVCGNEGGRRDPSAHPYAKNVLAWRIDRLLGDLDGGYGASLVFAPIERYIGGEAAPRRRFELASRLARMYDDYLNYRYPMLSRWEDPSGSLAGDEEPWQRELYRRLVRGNPGTYTKDYVKAFSDGAASARAFENGFPRYEAVHVFDVAFAPWPYFEILRRIAETLPVTFWNFSPVPGYWMEVEGKRERVRSRVAALRMALEDGTEPPEFGLPQKGEESDLALLGALGTGARGALLSEVDVSEGECLWQPASGGPPVEVEMLDGERPFGALHEVEGVELHSCHSPRRELEALRNGIYGWFSENPASRPRDVLVLCADWQSYAPLVEAVFGAERDEGMRIPVAVEGAVAEDTPLVHSFGDLLAFRDNRFEVNAVFALLGVPAIRRRFGIEAADVDTLMDIVRDANIHWGYDDDDVLETLGDTSGGADGPLPYTWRRGLDRLALDAVMGPRASSSLVDAGALGRILPCGNVESGRADVVARLGALVERLLRLRRDLRRPRSAEGWLDVLLRCVNDFYEVDGENVAELSELRRAVSSTARDAMNAMRADGVEGDASQIEPDVFLPAVQGAVRGIASRGASPGDVVRFAPLKNASAVTADFIWICGLNDGKFPRDGMRPSFDQIGRHPTPYDASLREWDCFALLKASLGARRRLAFSYVGRNIRTNEDIPPAVPLADILDWFRRNEPAKLVRYDHPLLSYSERYFYDCGGDALPPNYSSADRAAAEAMRGKPGRGAAGRIGGICAFTFAAEGETVVELPDLVSYLSRPNSFLLRRLKIRQVDPSGDALEDAEALGVHLGHRVEADLKLNGDAAGLEGDVLVEKGKAADVESAECKMRDILNGIDRDKILRRPMKLKRSPEGYRSDDTKAVELLRRVREASPERVDVLVEVTGRPVRVVGTLPLAEDNGTDHYMAYSEFKGELGEVECDILVHHLLGHAAGMRFLSVAMYGDGTLKGLHPTSRESAERKLRSILELAFSPAPDGLPRLDVKLKDDMLPEAERAAVLDDMEFIPSATLPRVKK